jgi:hypothetical protein
VLLILCPVLWHPLLNPILAQPALVIGDGDLLLASGLVLRRDIQDTFTFSLNFYFLLAGSWFLAMILGREDRGSAIVLGDDPWNQNNNDNAYNN